MTDYRHDLPRCPFCGRWPADAGEFYTVCMTPGCAIENHMIEVEAWCRRPLEREYDVDLQHAREAYQDQARTLDQVRLNWRGLAPIIDAALERGM